MRSALSQAARWLRRCLRQWPSRALGWLRHWPRRKIVVYGCVSLALLLIGVAATGFVVLKHFNANIQQDDISGLLGAQPVDLHPQAENIMVIGSDSRAGLSNAFGSGLVTDQSDTLMIIHIPASRQWAEVMSIPRDSWVNIPSCEMGDGQLSSPTQYKINEAFAIGNLDGNHTNLGIACTVKTLEQDTGIYINHFVEVNFTGLEEMVAALGGVYECNPTPINDPNSNLHLAAGTHLLTPAQALGYVRARYTLGDGSDLERIGRQQAFMSSLVSRVKSQLLNPLAIYRFLDAATKSLTIDSQLGGITGLYNLGESLRDIPSSKIAFFTLPNFPRGEVVPGDTANVLWTEPEDTQIFASFRNDVPASGTLFATPATPATAATAPATVAAGLAAGSQPLAPPSATPTAAAGTGSGLIVPAPTAVGSSPPASPSGSPSASGTSSAFTIQARTADQSICAG
jgi:LCP family protein required for cell wall assembly